MRLCAALLALAAATFAQDLEGQLRKKLAKPFRKRVAWVTDYDEAKRKSKELNKPIFAYFTRSYEPDPGGDQVEDGVFLSKEFHEFSRDYVMFLHVTTMIRSRKDDELYVARIGGKSFPGVSILDVDGGVLAEHRGAPTVAAFRATSASAHKYFAMRKKALEGDRDARLEYALFRAERGQITSNRLKREIARVGRLTPEEEQRVKPLLTGLLFQEAELHGQGRWYAEMEQQGLVPDHPQEKLFFYLGILGWLEHAEDVAGCARVIGILAEMIGKDPRGKPLIEKANSRLADLKSELANEKAGAGK